MRKLQETTKKETVDSGNEMNVKNLEKEMILKELEAENKALAQKTSMVAYIVIGVSTMCCCCLAGLGIYFLADARKKERELQERL
jgi:hypothetical protein